MQSIITGRKRSLGQGNIFRSVCQEFCPRGGMCGWGGACMARGHVLGACMVGVCMAGGMHGGGMCGGGHACLGGCAWREGMHGGGHAWQGACMPCTCPLA